MGMFKKNVNLEQWASLVIIGYVKGMPIDESLLKEATHSYVMQHSRIANDSLDPAINSPDEETKQMRQELVRKQARELLKIRRYANKDDQIIIDTIVFNAKWMEETLSQDNAAVIRARRDLKKAKKDAFWETQATMDMIDIFSEDWNNRY